ncbi:MAG: DUF2336 domain-containing protein [Alphaproteobacteria bacterium]|nr:DUF2336 domain-containing protein [Alphaproteobacteria bacterium]
MKRVIWPYAGVAPNLNQQLENAARGKLSRREALAVLEERTQSSQEELAQQTDAGDDVLNYLAAHGGVATRRAVAANAAAPVGANQILSDDEDDDVRAELVRKIVRLMPDLTREEAIHLRTISIELLENLARDQAPRVRAILADEIKHLDCIPKSIIDVLARDMEEIVAAPILEYSPLLSDEDLIEIIAGARAQHALAAIARRQPVSSDVSDAIVATLDVPAVAALLANPRASIRQATLDNLVDAASTITALHHPLTLHADLSTRTIRRLASFVGAALLETLAARSGLDDRTRRYLDKRLRERLRFGDRPAMQPAEATAQSSEIIDEKYLDEAAKAGNREAIILGLSAISQVPAPIVRRILESRSGKAIIALVWKARLNVRLAVKIQNFVMRLDANERVPARNGNDFPMSEDEMRWQLNYFDVPA